MARPRRRPGEIAVIGEGREEFTVDTLLRGRVTLLQPVRGFRSSLDPVLLAGFLAPPFGKFLDIGCGTGALSFLLLAGDPGASGVAVELQPALARLAAEGCERNGFAARLRVITGDVRGVGRQVSAARFDVVATNPPFHPLGTGQVPPDDARALAHHEVSLSLPEWLSVAARAARPGGRVAVIFPADRLVELLSEMRERDLSPARLRAVHPLADRPASRVLVEAQRAGRRPLVVEPPLIVHADGERYTAEVRRFLGE
jgi:tRNA1Val (adenine37-N6)-methyltransferase